MTREETLDWFDKVAKDVMFKHYGLFSTFVYAIQDESDKYHFYIQFTPYSCEAYDTDCDECRAESGVHGSGCYEEDLYIMENGNIRFNEKEYTESEFNILLENILL